LRFWPRSFVARIEAIRHYCFGEIMHLGTAITAHNEWKKRFRTAITKRDMIDMAVVSADNCCALGKWLNGEGKRFFGKLPSHTHCVATHEIFHREAGKIAEAINSRKFDDAENMLGTNTPFSDTSNALTAAILRLKRDATNSPGIISLIAKLSE
jgi:chemoreceptor zinc-binding protein